MAARAIPSGGGANTVIAVQTVNLYKGPRYPPPGFSYGASNAVRRDGTNTSVIRTSWLPVPRIPKVRQLLTMTASLAGHIVSIVTGAPSAPSIGASPS